MHRRKNKKRNYKRKQAWTLQRGGASLLKNLITNLRIKRKGDWNRFLNKNQKFLKSKKEQKGRGILNHIRGLERVYGLKK